MKTRRTLFVSVLSLALVAGATGALTGCAGSQSSTVDAAAKPTPTSASPTPTPSASASTPDAASAREYATAVELRDAAVAAGANCDDWVAGSSTPGVVDGGTCNGEIGVSIVADIAARNHILELNGSSLEGQPFIVGPNWLYSDQSNSGDPIASMKAIAPALGGTFWDPHDAIPE